MSVRHSSPGLKPGGSRRELAEIPPRDPAAASLDRAVRAVLGHRWTDGPRAAHAEHRYDSECAVCQGDVAAVLAVAAPLIAGQERARIVARLRDRAERFLKAREDQATVGAAWKCHEAASSMEEAARLIEAAGDG